MRDIQAIVFDFDGTLVDASEAILGAFQAALRARGAPDPGPEWVRSRIGRPLLGMFAELDPDASEIRLREYVEDYRAHFFPISAARTRLLPGVAEALELLAVRCRFAIATSRSAHGAVHILRGLDLHHHFPVIVGIDEVARPKPDPEPVLLALSQLGLDPARAMMVGDTSDDVEAGRRAGAVAVGVCTGAFSRADLERAGADHVLDDLGALPALLADLA